ncbi:MAG: hypothetical protein OHK0032_11040 [Thermodesulfovibrionales bacterium]
MAGNSIRSTSGRVRKKSNGSFEGYNQFFGNPEALINCLEETVLLLDRKGVITFINRTGEEFFGKGYQEIVGKKLKDVFPDAGSISILAKKAIRELRTFSARDVAVKINDTSKTGSTKVFRNPWGHSVDFYIAPFIVGDRCEGALFSIREDIAIAERDDSSFDYLIYLLGTIAHEIKNPLGGIKGAAQLLKARLSEGRLVGETKFPPHIDDTAAEYTNLIIKETDRLNSILQSYLTISRRPALHQINIHEVLEKAISIMNASLMGGRCKSPKGPFKNADITLERFYDPSLPKVIGDEGKLLQVFVNIIKNAIEAMPGGGILSIETRPSREHAVLNGR